MLNNVDLCGRLTATPELKHTSSGVAVTSFTIAVERDYQTNGQRQTDFFDIVAWRGTSEFICRNFIKGEMIIIDGSLQTRKYQTKDGNTRTVVEVVADNAYFCGSKRKDTNEGNYTPEPEVAVPPKFNAYKATQQELEEVDGLDDSDLPF